MFGSGEAPPFSEPELRRALAPHLPAAQAAEEAATIARTLRDAPMTGATLNDDILAMLAVTEEAMAERVERYRRAAWARRREAWLRREGRFGGESPDALEARWAERRAAADAEWASLVERVRAAVERRALRDAGVEGGLVQLRERRGAGEPDDD